MIDLKEERQYERLRKLGQKLHIPITEAFWTLEVLDKDGKLIRKHHQRSHSWTRNAYNVLFVQLAGKGCTGVGAFGAGDLNIKEWDASIRGAAGDAISISGLKDPDVSDYAYDAEPGDTLHGILVGSGTNAESFEDYQLQTLITQGSGAGQLHYAGMEANALTNGAMVLTNTLVRYLNNNSGGGVAVNEVCLVTYGYWANAAYHGLFARDKLGATVTVPDTGQVKVTYTIQLTYPS